MHKVMYQFRSDAEPDLVSAANIIGVTPSDLDGDFGVIQTSRLDRLYTVLVRESALPQRERHSAHEGPFSDPAIAPFGPVQVTDSIKGARLNLFRKIND